MDGQGGQWAGCRCVGEGKISSHSRAKVASQGAVVAVA